jgi:hypothetical protein
MAEKNNNQEQEIQKKKQIMLGGIIGLMLVVVVLWIINMKNFISPYSEKFLTGKESNAVSWQEVQSRFDTTLDQVKQRLDKISSDNQKKQQKQESQNTINDLAASLEAKASSTTPTSTAGIINDLEDNLQKKQ